MRTSKESVGLFANSARSLSSAMRNMGIAVTAASAISGAAMLTLSRRAERANAAFREVDTITNSLQSSQEKYGDIVSDLNTEFGLQANRVDAIRGLYQSLSAGIEDTEESQREFLETAGQLATVGLVDLETSVDVLSTVLNTYNMETDEAERVSESLFRTVQLGKVTLDELAPVMGRIAALGSEMGVSIEELGASMAQLTRNGFEARIAATGLRAVIRGFMRPSDDMKDALRDIALEQDGLVDSLTEGNDAVSNLASDYRNALSALEQFEEAQREARREQDELSLSVQRARLAITAIEQDRIDQLDDATVAELARSNSVEELEEQIEEYQLSLNEARITESEARLEQEETEEQIQDLKQEFVEEAEVVGDLGDGIGELFLENEGLVDTLVQLNDATDDADLGMDDLFQRTRGLQAALALVGEDGENFVEILEGFQEGSLDAEEAWGELSEEVREEEFDGDIENFKELQDLDMEDLFEDMIGPQEELRNEMSRLGETVEEIGDIFTDDLVNQIENFVDWVDGIRERIEGMDDSTQESIAQFAILATSIGLVLGPLLLLGGQIALIASAMGVGLIPFLGVAAVLTGVFASALSSVMSEGEESEDTLSSLEDTLSKLVSFVTELGDIFNDELRDPLIFLGIVVRSLFGTISDELGGVSEFSSVLRDIASAGGDLIERFATLIDENEELIASVIGLAVDVIVNQVLPPFRELALGIWMVIESFVNFFAHTRTGQAILALIIGPIIILGRVVLTLVGALGKLLQFLAPVLGPILGIAAGVIALVAGFSLMVARVAALASRFVPLVNVLVRARNMFFALRAVGAQTTPLFTTLRFLVARFIQVLSNLFPALGTTINIFRTLAARINELGAVLMIVASLVWGGIMLIWSAFKWLYEALVGNSIVPDLINSILEWFDIDLGQKAKNMVMSFVNGMLDKIGDVKDAAKSVAGTVKDYLGFGSAPDALGEDYNPKNYGENIGDSLTDGMEDSVADVEGESTNLAEASVPDTEDIEYDASATEGEQDFAGGGSGVGQDEKTEVTVEEGAIKVGPFHGLADDEVVEKVDEEVDQSMEQLVEDLRAKGIGGE